MNNTQPKTQTAIGILTDATIAVVGLSAREQGWSYEQLNVRLVCDSVRHVLKTNLDEIMEEWAAMIDLPEYQIRQAMNLQANAYGRMAWKTYQEHLQYVQ